MIVDTLIKEILHSELICILLQYTIINTILWTIIINFSRKRKAEIDNKTLHNNFNVKKAYLIGYQIALALPTVWVLYVYLKIGFYPYGPDTSPYTFVWHYLSINGRWDDNIATYFNPYYTLYHTTAVSIYLFKIFIGDVQVSLYVWLAVLFFVEFLGILLFIKNLYTKINVLSLILGSIIILATPYIFLLDPIQQYTSIVYALFSIHILYKYFNNNSDLFNYLILTIFIIISVITHLSSILLMLTFILSFILYKKTDSNTVKDKEGRRKTYRILSLIFLIVVTYNLYTLARFASIFVIKDFITNFINLIKKGSSTMIVRAYTEIPNSKYWLYSHTVLPSFGLAYILSYIFNKKTNCSIKLSRILFFGDLSVVISFEAMMIYSFGAISRFVGIDLFRYFAVPSYYLLFIAFIMWTQDLDLDYVKNNINVLKKIIAFTLLASLIIITIHTGLLAPEHAPWNGGLRLAPVTYIDRLESRIISYCSGTITVATWHDVYIPYELLHSCNVKFVANSYYPMQRLLLSIVKCLPIEDYNIISNAYFVPPKAIINKCAYMKYNVIFNGVEHIWFH